MFRFRYLFCCCILCVSLASACVKATRLDFDLPDFLLKVEGQELTITKYRGSGGNITIPERHLGMPITKIGNSAFSNAPISSVRFERPSQIKYFGDSSFYQCFGLSKFDLTQFPKLEYIGNSAFYGCPFDRFVVPASVKRMGQNVFNPDKDISASIEVKVLCLSPPIFTYLYQDGSLFVRII